MVETRGRVAHPRRADDERGHAAEQERPPGAGAPRAVYGQRAEEQHAGGQHAGDGGAEVLGGRQVAQHGGAGRLQLAGQDDEAQHLGGDDDAGAAHVPVVGRSSTKRRNMKAAVPAAAATATPPTTSGHAECVCSAQRIAMPLNTAKCTMLSPQKSRTAPWRDSRNFRRASSPSQPSRIEWARNSSAPVSCQAGAADRKHGAAARPMATLTTVIMLGVTDVSTSRRVTAIESFRSKWRGMNPSLCLIRVRESPSLARRPAPPPAL